MIKDQLTQAWLKTYRRVAKEHELLLHVKKAAPRISSYHVKSKKNLKIKKFICTTGQWFPPLITQQPKRVLTAMTEGTPTFEFWESCLTCYKRHCLPFASTFHICVLTPLSKGSDTPTISFPKLTQLTLFKSASCLPSPLVCPQPHDWMSLSYPGTVTGSASLCLLPTDDFLHPAGVAGSKFRLSQALVRLQKQPGNWTDPSLRHWMLQLSDPLCKTHHHFLTFLCVAKEDLLTAPAWGGRTLWEKSALCAAQGQGFFSSWLWKLFPISLFENSTFFWRGIVFFFQRDYMG